MTRREEILQKIADVPALPAAATQVLTLTQDPDAGIADVMKIIEYDPGLTADVLRLANSAYFAGPRTISSLRDAGVLFGMNRIQQMVIASAVFPLAQPAICGYDLSPGRLVDRLIAVGVGAEELGKALRQDPPQYTFTAGLLHGVGKIVLGTFIEVEVQAIKVLAYEEGIPFDEAERNVLGIDYAEVGAALLEYWQLPANVVDAVRYHNRPDDAPRDKIVVDLVHYANILSIGCGLGTGIDGLHYRPCPGTIERLNVETKVSERVTCKMLAGLQSFAQEQAAPT